MRAAAIVAAVLLCGCPAGTAPSPAARAEAALRAGRYAEAEGIATESLAGAKPDEVTLELVGIAVRAALAAGRPERAVRTHDAFPLWVPSELKPELAPHFLADGRLGLAIRAYRAGLDKRPDNADWHEALAKLLGTAGLRDQALPHVMAVAARRETDLLLLTAVESGLIRDEETLRAALRRATSGGVVTDPLPAYGLAAVAYADGDLREAEKWLDVASTTGVPFPPAEGLRGRILAEAGDLEGLARWASDVEGPDRLNADGWLAVGRLAESRSQWAAAASAYDEAASLRPESREAVSRLAAALQAAGREKDAGRVAARVPAMQRLRDVQSRVLFGDGPRGPADLAELVTAYADAGREAEAAAWGRMAVELNAGDAAFRRRVASLDASGDRLVAAGRRPTDGLDADRDAALAFLRGLSGGGNDTGDGAAVGAVPVLADVAAEVGVGFRYDNAAGDPPALRMYEFAGGGVAAVDYDGDLRCDLFFTQAGGLPPAGATDGDRLLRNRGAAADVTAQAFLREADYGQGVAAGDVDGDGFADLYVANLGPNALWRNLGDGTFERVLRTADGVWTASCLIADLTGDGAADLLDVNYLRGDDLLDRVCRASDGQPAMCMPYDFEAEPDVLRPGDRSGGFAAAPDRLESATVGKGLGVLAFREAGQPTASVFVANDLTPNQLYVPDGGSLRDEAVVRGVALNGSGKAEGCMGIAAADVNGDGRLDLHVTNFLAETNTLFASVAGDSFADRTAEAGLAEPTRSLLGFGTQFLDADADGRQELFVANGHLQDLTRLGRPYQMPAQLFAAAGGRLADVSGDAGAYFQQEVIGRSAAVLDWDGDGAEELAVTHLDRPAALLRGEAAAAVRIDFVGVACDRTGVGVTATAEAGGRTLLRSVTAGGGYMAENEHAVTFGLGGAKRLEGLTVSWPSGREDTFGPLPAGRWRVVEGGRPRRLPE